VRGFAGAYSGHVTRLLADNRYGDALKFIDEEPQALGDKILLLQQIATAYHRAENTSHRDEVYQKMFDLVDTLAEKESKKETAGKPDNPGIGDDRRGWLGASLVKSYSHPIVKQHRDRGNLHAAVDLAQKLFSTHAPEVEILYIARAYADAGDYAGAMEVGGAAAGSFGSDSGIKGYVAHTMFKHGKKDDADKLLTDTLREIDNGDTMLHQDFIVGLALCDRIEDAIRLSMSFPVTGRSENENPTDQHSKQPTLILHCLLTTHREKEAMQLIDDWKYGAGKAWAIWTFLRWNLEEHLDKGTESLLTREWKKRWTDFLVNYVDTLDEPNAINRAGEYYRAAECLIGLGAEPAALNVLNKALAVIQNHDRSIPDHSRFGSVNVRIQTGKLLIRLGQYEKAEIAFVSAVQDCSMHEKDYRSVGSLKEVLSEYSGVLMEDNPECIYSWRTYNKSYGRIIPLKELWQDHRLFSSYMIM
jgi:tetratricopeptide (TPR) repeat protein